MSDVVTHRIASADRLRSVGARSTVGVSRLTALLGEPAPVGPLASLVLASVYLGYTMVAKVASLCTMCVNLAALNVLILVELVR